MGIKYKVNEDFFKRWDRPMAYILGYIYADGNLINAPTMRGRYLTIVGTDKDRIVIIKSLMNSAHTIRKRLPNGWSKKTVFILRIGSKEIYQNLEKRGLKPNKSLTMKFPKIPKKYLFDFVRGYFDGDGCIYFGMSNSKDGTFRIIRYLRTIFTSGSKDFIEKLADVLFEQKCISKTKIYFSSRAWQLHLGTKESLRLYKRMYPRKLHKELYLVRKKKIFQEYYSVIENRSTMMRNGHVAKK